MTLPRGIHFPGAGNRFAQRWPSIYLPAVFRIGSTQGMPRPQRRLRSHLARVIQRPTPAFHGQQSGHSHPLALAGHIPGPSLPDLSCALIFPAFAFAFAFTALGALPIAEARDGAPMSLATRARRLEQGAPLRDLELDS